MDKILVTVHVPTIERNFDMFVPINVLMKDIVDYMQRSIHELSGGYYVIKEKITLFDSMEGKLINQNNIVKFSGLKNGSHVLIL